MGTWGYFEPFVLGEDEGACVECGWDPYHVAHGFGKDASTVTIRETRSWGPQVFPRGTDAVPVLEWACIQQRRVVPPEMSGGGMDTVLVTPPVAKVLANGGYSKKDVAQYLWEHTRITGRERNQLLNSFHEGYSLHRSVMEGNLPKWFDIGPDESVPYLASADLIEIVICGDAGRNKIMTLFGGSTPVTKEIKLPPNFDKMMQET